MSKNLYIVPYDFTPVADKAVEFALHIGKRVNAEIKIMHLAEDKAKGMAKVQALEDYAKKIEAPFGCEVTSLVKVGNIFTDIARIAAEEKAQLIIMGTHGVSGFQWLAGSNAMKVITSADCPFLIVQKHTKLNDISDILVPIDLTKESLQVVTLAGDMAAIFHSRVHVIAEKQNDQILNTRIQNRIGIVNKTYEERGMEAKLSFVKSGNYGKRVIQYAEANNIGMLAVSYHSESLLPQFDKFAQNLITNKEGLPVLIINSKLASALYF
jgi:nucleotide-binding universal stress UspA family protein